MAITINVKWATNTDELKAALASGTDQISAMKQSVDRTAASLGGEGLLRAANNATAAVAQLGGATKLTATEKERLNTLLEKAITKYDALGRTAPTAMKELAAATHTAGEETGFSIGKFLEGIPLVEGFIAAFSVERIVEFGKQLIESAARINVLAQATGISAAGVQALGYVGVEFGLDMEQMARGVEQFSRRLAGGDAGATRAVQSLGLSVRDLIAAGPEQAFIAFADAAGKVEDPMQRARLASEAFGAKLGLTLLPLLNDIKPKMKEAGESGAIMADDTVKAAHQMEVAWDHAWMTFKAFMADLLLHKGTPQQQFEGLEGGGAFQVPASAGAPDQDPAEYAKWLKSIIAPADAISNAQLIENELKALRTQAIEPLTAAQRQQIAELKEWGKGEKEIAQLVGSNEIAIHRYVKALEASESAAKKTAAAHQKFADIWAELDTVGNGWRGTLDGIDGAVVEAIQYYLAAGYSQEKLAIAYGLTAVQVKAVDAARQAELATLKELEKIHALEFGGKPVEPLGGTIPLIHPGTDYKDWQKARDEIRKVEVGGKPLGPLGGEIELVKPIEQYKEWLALQKRGDEALRAMADSFVQMAQVAGDSLGSILRGVGALIVGLEAARRQAELFRGPNVGVASGLFASANADGSEVTRTQRAQSALASGAAIAQGAQNVWAATESHRTAMGNALGGGMAGAQAGSQFGIYGTIIGFVGGFVVGLIRGKPEWAKIADDIGRDFGTKISDALAKQIQADSKKLAKEHALATFEAANASGDPEAIRKAALGLIHPGTDHQAAGIQNIGGIISEAGGLTAANLGTFEARLRDVFVMLAEHRFTAAEATKVLNDNFAQFAQAGTDKLGFLDAKMIEMIQLTHQAGLEVKAITEYEQAQISKAMEGINAIVAGTEDARKGYDAVKKGVDDATEALKQLTDKGITSGKAFDEAAAALKKSVDAQQTTAAGAKQELADLGLVAVASFNAAIKAGMTFAEALAKLHPTLETLRKDFKDLGLDPDDPLMKTLFTMDAVATKAAALVNAAAAMPGVLTGMANVGAMDPKTFASMERTGYAQYVRIQDKVAQEGGGTKEALMFMQPWLHAAEEYARKNGIALDDNTQMMINQSKEEHIWKEVEKTENEKLMESIAKLKGSIDANTVALGGTAPSDQSGEKKPGENGHAGGGTGEKTGGGNGPPITPGDGPPHRLPYHPHDPVVHGGGYVEMGRILRFHGGGLASDEVPAILQTGEAVLSRRAVAALGVATVQALNTGGASVASAAPSGGTSTSTVHLTMHVHLPTGAAADADQFAQVALDTLRRDVRGFRTAVENVAKQAAA